MIIDNEIFILTSIALFIGIGLALGKYSHKQYKKKNADKKEVTFEIDKEQYEQLKELALKLETTMDSMIIAALHEHLDLLERIIKIESKDKENRCN